jgi:hypothetical protein
VLGGGHDPIVWNNGKDFAQAIQHLIDTPPATTTSKCIHVVTKEEEEEEESKSRCTSVMNMLQDILRIDNTGVFCVATTNKRIHQWCSKLTSKEWFQLNSSKQPTCVIDLEGKITEIREFEKIFN